MAHLQRVPQLLVVVPVTPRTHAHHHTRTHLQSKRIQIRANRSREQHRILHV
jgi:hypothetical protein